MINVILWIPDFYDRWKNWSEPLHDGFAEIASILARAAYAPAATRVHR
jgi:hypothetical protein